LIKSVSRRFVGESARISDGFIKRAQYAFAICKLEICSPGVQELRRIGISGFGLSRHERVPPGECQG
jgi:hypothetical protein